VAARWQLAGKTRRYNYNEATVKWKLKGKQFTAQLMKAVLYYKCETPGEQNRWRVSGMKRLKENSLRKGN
jgi:hypothetical protein